ncbi:MAG: YihY/virulence factor BrkB family protein [Eubacterium sp.]|nr:YihY/virulence factor BrkB family protein [Eubacterium sp.]
MKRMKDMWRFWSETADEHMGAFAAQSAFFIFLSFFPLINIVISLPRFLPFTQDQMLEVIYFILPHKFENYVGDIVKDMYLNSSNSMTIISVIITLWSSAKGIMAIRNGLNEVYRSRENRNYFIIRGISSIYTLIFIVIFIALIPVNMFGTQIVLNILGKFPHYANEALLALSLRSTATFILLFVMFDLMYTIVPTRKLRLKNQMPGAFFAALSWVGVTKIFSLYVDYYAAKSYMYGSLTTVIMLLFWMYFVIYLVFVGAQLNEYLHTCRIREEKYELSKYSEEKREVWEDDDIVKDNNDSEKQSMNERGYKDEQD